MGRIKRSRKSAAAMFLFCITAIPGAILALYHGFPSLPEKIKTMKHPTAAVVHSKEQTTQTCLSEPTSAANENQEQKACWIENVPHYYQMDKFPTGCESVAAVSLMQFYGISISVEEFIDGYLPMADIPCTGDDGLLHGESPWEYFIGDPRLAYSYGCYSTVILRAMEAAVPESYEVKTVTASSLELLTEDYLAKGSPVLIWATMEMQESQPGTSWILSDGSEFTFLRPEHALLLIGADTEYYYFSDSMSKDMTTAYPKVDCENAFSAMGQQAVVVIPPAN